MIRMKPLGALKLLSERGSQKKTSMSITRSFLLTRSNKIKIDDSLSYNIRGAVTTTRDKDNSLTGRNSRLYIYPELSKYRLSALVVVTSGAGFLCAGAPIDLCSLTAVTTGTALCAASAGTFNQVLEQGHDAKMLRTRLRPLPSGRISTFEATTWGVSSGLAGTGLLLAATNPVVSALGALNIFIYAIPYTLSKQHTEWNTWIGAVVGAIPPIMGYAAATGGEVAGGTPMALVSLLFLWQFPHFFSLSWLHREDYARGGFQMIAVNDPLGVRSAGYIWEYSLYLSTLPIITSATGLTSWMFAVEGSAANLYLLYLAYAFKRDQSNASARKVFLCSLWYLPLLLGAYIFHSKVWNETMHTEDMITDFILGMKEKLRSVCVHDLMILYNEQPHAVQSANITTYDEDDSADIAVVVGRDKEKSVVNSMSTIVSTSGSGSAKSQSIGHKICMKIVGEKMIDNAVQVIPEAAGVAGILSHAAADETPSSSPTPLSHSISTTTSSLDAFDTAGAADGGALSLSHFSKTVRSNSNSNSSTSDDGADISLTGSVGSVTNDTSSKSN